MGKFVLILFEIHFSLPDLINTFFAEVTMCNALGFEKFSFI